MAYIVTVNTRIPRMNEDRVIDWWMRAQRRSLSEQDRLLTPVESETAARQRFGDSIELIDIALSIDLNEEQMLHHVEQLSVEEAEPREVERILQRDDVMRAGRPRNFKCAICLRKRGRVVKTRCKHYFHRPCIERAFRFSTRCPICRTEIVAS